MRAQRQGRGVEALLFALAALFLVLGYGPATLAERPFEPGPRAAGTLRVVTWNVGGSVSQGAPALRDEDLAHVAEVLRALEPELCFLEEVESREQAARLGTALGEDWSAQAGRSAWGRRVVCLARGGALERLRFEGEGGRVLGVLLHLPGGRDVAAVGLHADAFSAERRNAEVGAALEQLLERGEAKLLLGDLNLNLNLDKKRELFSDDEHLDVETYNYVAERMVDAARGRGSTAEPDRRLDYVFVDPASFEVLSAGPWKGRRAGAMDHDPVVADLAWIR